MIICWHVHVAALPVEVSGRLLVRTPLCASPPWWHYGSPIQSHKMSKDVWLRGQQNVLRTGMLNHVYLVAMITK